MRETGTMKVGRLRRERERGFEGKRLLETRETGRSNWTA
jgi:hypothetical protein